MKPALKTLALLCLLASCAPRLAGESIINPGSGKPSSTSATTQDALKSKLVYALPLPKPSIISKFGEQGSGMILQTALAGEAVKAVQAGVVTEMSKLSANDGYLVTIEHPDSFSTTYLNLQAVPLVKLGDKVSKNQIIGYLGGGSLVPPNVLKFFASTLQNGQLSFIDPSLLVRFN